MLCGWLQESNGWGFGFGSENETTTSYDSNFEKVLHKEENGSISFPSSTNVSAGGSSWAFNQPSLDTGKEKEVLYLTIHSQCFRMSIIYGFHKCFFSFSAGFEMKSSDFWW